MKAGGSLSISCNITVPSAGVALLRIRRAGVSWPEPHARAVGAQAGNAQGDFQGTKAARIALSESLDASADELVRVAKEFGFEGIVAKREDSVYGSGKRTGAWVKYKVNRGQELVIGGYTRGNPFGALIVGYYEGNRLFYAAKVRNGFVPQLRRDVATRFKGLKINACPFANLPERKRTQWALTKEEMKNCVWFKPELVAQIEFTEWTLDGHLRLQSCRAERRQRGWGGCAGGLGDHTLPTIGIKRYALKIGL